MELPQDVQAPKDSGDEPKKGLKNKKLIVVGAGLLTLVFAVAMIVMTLVGASNNVNELGVEVARSKADVILANAKVVDETVVTVPILYYDQKMDACADLYDSSKQLAVNARQFEWRSCGYYNEAMEADLVETELDSEYLPVGKGGALVPNRGLDRKGFERWFSAVEGLSKSYAGTLNLVYDANAASFNYESEEFYPLNEIVVPEESVNDDGNNHLFTFNLGIPFQVLASGDEEFVVVADDDTWVFVGDRLVLDMGGVHNAIAGRFIVHKNGEIYAGVGDGDLAYTGVNVISGNGAIIRIFHADRNSENSVLKLQFRNMALNIVNTTLARGENGVEVAYDPANPSYIAPLGESLVVGPDKSRMLVTVIAVQMIFAAVFGVLIVVVISVGWRYLRHDRNLVR